MSEDIKTRYFVDTYSGVMIKQEPVTTMSGFQCYDWYRWQDGKWDHLTRKLKNNICYTRVVEITEEEAIVEMI